MSTDLYEKCRNYKDARNAQSHGFYPYFRKIKGFCEKGNYVVCEGEKKLMIGSNNYLSLAHDPRVIESACQAAQKFGSGCTGSRLLNGNLTLHEELEEALAAFLRREKALLFSSGFFVNQGFLSTITEEGDCIFCDRENHASIIDGCMASKAKFVPFAHNSASSLMKRIKRQAGPCGKLVVVDGVFSMSGDIADLPNLVKTAKDQEAFVYIDEAHALGILGEQGRGSVDHFHLNSEVDVIMGTFSKSLGSMGGFLAGSAELVNFLKHKTRCFIFTASLAPAVVGGVLKALEIMQEEPERIEQLWKNTHKMHSNLKEMGFRIGSTQTPIVPILIGSETRAFRFAQRLYECGIFATPAVYPAVRYGQAIVRTSYMSSHTEKELDYVLEVFAKLAKELDIFYDPIYTGSNQPKNVLDFSLPYEEGLPLI